MSVEELVQAAEFKLKELDPDAMQDFVDRALKLDPGYSRARLCSASITITKAATKKR